LVLSLPDLGNFLPTRTVQEEPLAIFPHASQRRSLVSLQLVTPETEFGTALTQCGLASPKFSLFVYDTGLEQLLTLPSEVIVEPRLFGVWSSGRFWEQRQY